MTEIRLTRGGFFIFPAGEDAFPDEKILTILLFYLNINRYHWFCSDGKIGIPPWG